PWQSRCRACHGPLLRQPRLGNKLEMLPDGVVMQADLDGGLPRIESARCRPKNLEDARPARRTENMVPVGRGVGGGLRTACAPHDAAVYPTFNIKTRTARIMMPRTSTRRCGNVRRGRG